jgi:hypothetical protein
MDDKLQAYDLLEMLILKLALRNLDDNHHLISSFHGLYEISLVMHIHDTTQTYICNGLVHKA